MRRISPPAICALLLSLLVLAACGDDAESRRPPPRAGFAGVVEPWDTLAPDSIYGALPAENLRVVRADLDLLGIPAGWEGMRIAVISDLQLGLWRDNPGVAAAALRRAVAERPDLIVLLGDYLGTGTDTVALKSALTPLRGHPVLAVLGDRDIRSDSLGAAITRTLAAGGVRVLKNSAVSWSFGGDTANIAGVDPDLATGTEADQEWILSQLGGPRRALLLTHIPQLMARAPKGRFPGVLAGNTFCGRVEVRGTPRLSWLTATAIPGAAVPGHQRFFRFGDSVMFVTCGTGYGFIPARFGAPPEVALVTLHPILAQSTAGTDSVAARARADSLSMDTLLQRYNPSDSTAAPDSSR